MMDGLAFLDQISAGSIRAMAHMKPTSSRATAVLATVLRLPARPADTTSPETNGTCGSRDHHPGYISWQEYEDNQKLLLENAHMKKNCARKSARGGRALLTGLMAR